MLRRMQHAFPVVDIKYDPDSAVTPVILHIRPHLDLLFSGQHQRLHTICLRKLRDTNPPVMLKFKETILSSADEVLRRVGVSRTFGPTYPGDDLRYPGVLFSFEEDSRNDNLKCVTAHGDDKTQEVKRVVITQKTDNDEVRDALDEVVECPAMSGELSKAILKVNQVMRHAMPTSQSDLTGPRRRGLVLLPVWRRASPGALGRHFRTRFDMRSWTALTSAPQGRR